MTIIRRVAIFIAVTLVAYSEWSFAKNSNESEPQEKHSKGLKSFQNELGPRPYYLIKDMDEGPLKYRLKRCEDKLFYKTSRFSIGHRGAPMQFPEHTKESYEAAAKMGAGIIECDVTFTNDRELVCRHSQCDLHTTTNILAIPELAEKCSVPFTPANPLTGQKATAKCCTSDINLQEFKSLCGKMDASNPDASSVQEYLSGTANWRTDLYSQCGTVLSHKESIALFKKLGTDMTPELKAPQVDMPFQGEGFDHQDYSQKTYAQQMINEYKEMGVHPRRVYPQSFNRQDVLYWIENEGRFGKQAIYLDDRVYNDSEFEATLEGMLSLKQQGINIIAPPMWALLTVDQSGDIVPSEYAMLAKQAGLDIITWTLERDGPLANGGGWYHQSIRTLIDNDGDTYNVLHALAKKVGVMGVFSDWPATTTYYANCMGIR